MSKFCTLSLLAVARLALADASIAAPSNEFTLGRSIIDLSAHKIARRLPTGPICPDQDGPLTRARRSPVAKRLAAALPPKSDLYARQATAHHVLFSSGHWTANRRSIVFTVEGKQLLDLPREVSTLVEDPSGRLVGLLALDEKANTLELLDPKTGARLWLHPPGIRHSFSDATALVAGDTLVVALYHFASTGSALVALDLRTGARRWTGDVQQLMVGHSEYWNEVSLVARGPEVAMIGLEAYGCYLQTFNLATGARRFAHVETNLK